MPCPRCGSHDLWDDNLYWGCASKSCDFASSSVTNSVSKFDAWNGEFDVPWNERSAVRHFAKQKDMDWAELSVAEKRTLYREYLNA